MAKPRRAPAAPAARLGADCGSAKCRCDPAPKHGDATSARLPNCGGPPMAAAATDANAWHLAAPVALLKASECDSMLRHRNRI